MKIEPLIVVKDVQTSSQFYQDLLQCQSGHGGNEYEMLISDEQPILQLHRQETHEHPEIWDPKIKNGNGIVLWFRTDDFENVVRRARKLNAKIVAEPHVNQNALQNEFWIRDPDGYLVVISDKMGSVKTG